ncbi:MAG: helix-turn-helix domain-containing protein [Candidatus Omnitrophica bacterium]|nr:helix-turn-helix domain-containing protein [Candidatus Omnitrophota bacterium]
MGVTYKLKEEVINFVLEIKRDFPDTSCRQIASLASEKFKIEISKSSVNSILQRSALSSSVGRRNLYAKFPKKFEIPAEKKTQITEVFKNMQLDDKGELKAGKTAHIETVVSLEVDEVAKKELENKNLTLLGVGMNKSVPVFQDSGVEKVLSKNFAYAGIVFLKAAARDVLARELWSDEEQENRILQYLCLDRYGITEHDSEKALKNLEALFSMQTRRAFSFGNLNAKESIDVGVTVIKAIKIVLDDGRYFYFSPDDLAVCEDIDEAVAAPYQRCLDVCADGFLINRIPLVLNISSHCSLETEAAVDSLINGSSTLKKICFLDQLKNVFFEIKHIPNLPRKLVKARGRIRLSDKGARDWKGFIFDEQKILDDNIGDLIFERMKQRFFYGIEANKGEDFWKKIFSLSGEIVKNENVTQIKLNLEGGTFDFAVVDRIKEINF